MKQTRYKRDNTFLIGSDPEFVFAKNKEIISLVTLINSSARRLSNSAMELGTDGHAPIAELRPPPSPSAYRHYIEMRRIMSTAVANYPVLKQVNWMAGSWIAGKPIGGHIHFGIPFENHGENILYALNALVVPLMLALEDSGRAPRSGMRFQAKYYGLGNDYRLKSHGGWEWRAPSSWLVSPAATLAMLNICEVIASYSNWFVHSLTQKDIALLKYSDNKVKEANTEYFRARLDTTMKYLSMFANRAGSRWPSISYLKQIATRPYSDWIVDINFLNTWKILKCIKINNTNIELPLSIGKQAELSKITEYFNMNVKLPTAIVNNLELKYKNTSKTNIHKILGKLYHDKLTTQLDIDLATDNEIKHIEINGTGSVPFSVYSAISKVCDCKFVINQGTKKKQEAVKIKIPKSLNKNQIKALGLISLASQHLIVEAP